MENETIKVKFYTWACNQGDGSVVVRFYNSRESAEKAAENDEERYCDDIDSHTLEFDRSGNLIQ